MKSLSFIIVTALATSAFAAGSGKFNRETDLRDRDTKSRTEQKSGAGVNQAGSRASGTNVEALGQSLIIKGTEAQDRGGADAKAGSAVEGIGEAVLDVKGELDATERDVVTSVARDLDSKIKNGKDAEDALSEVAIERGLDKKEVEEACGK